MNSEVVVVTGEVLAVIFAFLAATFEVVAVIFAFLTAIFEVVVVTFAFLAVIFEVLAVTFEGKRAKLAGSTQNVKIYDKRVPGFVSKWNKKPFSA